MLARDPHTHAPEQQRLLDLQLPQRLASLRQRGERLRAGNWDINLLQRLAEDAALLAPACRRHAAHALATALDALHQDLAALLQPAQLPDAVTTARIAHALAQMHALPATLAGAAHTAVPGPSHESGFPLRVIPPKDYWTRFAAHPPAMEREPPAPCAMPAEVATAAPAAAHAAPAAAQRAPDEAALVGRIRHALEADGFELLFQPIMSLRGEDEEQFQALLRLRGADQRLHAAAEVIPAAERAGLIGAVDRWVLEHCITMLGARARHERWPRLFVSHSLASVRDAGFADWLHGLLARHRIAGSALVLELSVSDVARAFAEVVHHARALHADGIGFSLSAFSADAACEHLRATLPVDVVKLAPRYLRLDEASIQDELRALVARLHAGGQRVIAPRVEDARGAAALWSAGVDFIQGNFVQAADREFAFDFGEAVM